MQKYARLEQDFRWFLHKYTAWSRTWLDMNNTWAREQAKLDEVEKFSFSEFSFTSCLCLTFVIVARRSFVLFFSQHHHHHRLDLSASFPSDSSARLLDRRVEQICFRFYLARIFAVCLFLLEYVHIRRQLKKKVRRRASGGSPRCRYKWIFVFLCRCCSSRTRNTIFQLYLRSEKLPCVKNWKHFSSARLCSVCTGAPPVSATCRHQVSRAYTSDRQACQQTHTRRLSRAAEIYAPQLFFVCATHVFSSNENHKFILFMFGRDSIFGQFQLALLDIIIYIFGAFPQSLSEAFWVNNALCVFHSCRTEAEAFRLQKSHILVQRWRDWGDTHMRESNW